MKTLNKFKCANAEVQMQMQSPKDADFHKGTYKVIEKPRRKIANGKKRLLIMSFQKMQKRTLQQEFYFG